MRVHPGFCCMIPPEDALKALEHLERMLAERYHLQGDIRIQLINLDFSGELPEDDNLVISWQALYDTHLYWANRQYHPDPNISEAANEYARWALCWYCGCRGGDLVLEHRTPRGRGGSEAGSNVCLACRSCNAIKGPRTVSEFRSLLQFRSGTNQWVFFGETIPELNTFTTEDPPRVPLYEGPVLGDDNASWNIGL